MDFIFSDTELEAFIGYGTKISFANLVTFPLFLRFNEVLLNYGTESHLSLLTKCLLFEDCLNSIKPALKDSNEIRFEANIDQADQNDFREHSSVIIYLRYSLLPICNSSRRYVFSIWFESDRNYTTEVISSILQISQVQNCSNVYFNIWMEPTRLPVEDISNWLVPKSDDGVEICGNMGERSFRIYSFVVTNTQEIWDHLKEVNFVYNLSGEGVRGCSPIPSDILKELQFFSQNSKFFATCGNPMSIGSQNVLSSQICPDFGAPNLKTESVLISHNSSEFV